MGIKIEAASTRAIPAAALYALHQAVGWFPERSQDDYAQVLNTGPAVGAWTDSRLVGFARAISDHILHAYIDDVMVHPDWRRRGIAVQVVNVLFAELDGVPTVTLFCSDHLVGLYERASFARTRQVILHRHH